MAAAIGFLFRVAFTIIWSLLLSAVIRNVVWPWIKTVWKYRPTIAFAWK